MHSKLNKAFGRKRGTDAGLPQYSIVALGEDLEDAVPYGTPGIFSFHRLCCGARGVKVKVPPFLNKSTFDGSELLLYRATSK
jgi:hypothetical protein